MAFPFYDANLRNKLNANNSGNCSNSNSSSDSGIDGLVLNSQFSRWENVIEHNLDPAGRKDNDYSSAENLALLNEAKEHVRVYGKPVEAKNAIVLVHPLYLHLSNMNQLKTRKMKREANEYLDKLLWLFERNLPRERVNLIIMESLHYYAAATSLFLESGLIDRVIFTKPDTGTPLEESDLNFLYGKQVFVGGGYNHRCLRWSNHSISQNMRSRFDLWAIHDLIINKPNDCRWSMRPSKLTISRTACYDFSPFQVINLDTVIKMIGCREHAYGNYFLLMREPEQPFVKRLAKTH